MEDLGTRKRKCWVELDHARREVWRLSRERQIADEIVERLEAEWTALRREEKAHV
jgi:hypothetical protein